MNRKDKIRLLNGLLKGELPMACIFSEWPEKTYYALPDDEDNFETEDGELVSFQEVDHELMNYPKVRIVDKEPKEKDVKMSISHKYINENGDEVPESKCAFKTRDPDPPPEAVLVIVPDPLPEPFLSRQDRLVMEQGPLYCVR